MSNMMKNETSDFGIKKMRRSIIPVPIRHSTARLYKNGPDSQRVRESKPRRISPANSLKDLTEIGSITAPKKITQPKVNIVKPQVVVNRTIDEMITEEPENLSVNASKALKAIEEKYPSTFERETEIKIEKLNSAIESLGKENQGLRLLAKELKVLLWAERKKRDTAETELKQSREDANRLMVALCQADAFRSIPAEIDFALNQQRNFHSDQLSRKMQQIQSILIFIAIMLMLNFLKLLF